MVEFPRVSLVMLLATACGSHLHVGAGLARGGTSVGGETNSAIGPAFSLRAGVPDRRVGLLTALDVQPFEVRHPYIDEAFRIAYLLPSLQIKSDPVMLRGGLGLAFSAWSGAERISASETGPAFGVEIEVPVTRRESGWLVALSFKAAATTDGEMDMSLLSLYVVRRLF